MLSMLLVVFQGVVASEYSRAHLANHGIVVNGYGAIPVYKFIDSEGRVSYSTSASNDYIQAEEVTIISPPSSRHELSAELFVKKMK